jgi:hypothetical protein
MNEDELKAEMRLYAVEFLTANLFAMFCLMTSPSPRETLATARRQMIDSARSQTFPGLDDPAQSDLFSAELESAVDRLMEMGNAQIDRVLQAREGKNPGA